MSDDQNILDATDYKAIGEALAAAFTEKVAAGGVQKTAVSSLIEAHGGIVGMLFEMVDALALKSGEMLHKGEQWLMPLLAAFIAPSIAGLFGGEVDEALFARRISTGGSNAAALAIVDGFFRAIEGQGGGDIAPSQDGAKRFAAAAVGASLESTFNALVPELLSDVLGEFGPRFQDIVDLPEGIIRALGVGRLVRRAVGPLVDVSCATPMQWYVHKKYRPTLLGPGEVARLVTRGRWAPERANEELARAGYSDDRIEQLLKDQEKRLSSSDVSRLVHAGLLTRNDAIDRLQADGWAADEAQLSISADDLARTEPWKAAILAAATSAYVSRDIESAELQGAIDIALTDQADKTLARLAADTRRALNVKRLSLSEVAAMVKSGVLSVVDYRETAVREGYPDDDVAALELQLRFELQKDKDLAAARQQQADDRAAAKAAADATKAEKLRAVEEREALQRRGSFDALKRAAARGAIPFSRVEEVLTPVYDPDTVAILMDDVATARQAYLDQQAAADAARTRAKTRSIDVGALEAAVLAGTLTPAEFRVRLDQLAFTAADADLLTATITAKKADRDAAAAAHRDAAAAAKAKTIDLARFEQLVVRGHRTFAQYDAFLQTLGIDAPGRAGMTELLQLKIDDNAAAAKLRADTAAKNAVKGLSLEQFRRAVVLGVKSLDAFQTFLTTDGYTTDAQLVLVAELRSDVEAADAARARRAAADAAKDARALPLAALSKAASLGLLTPDAYRARLVALGYTADDVDLELGLLMTEITDRKAKEAAQHAADVAAKNKGLDLAQLRAAVKAGVRTIDDYRAALAGFGYTPDAVEGLTATLQAELDALAAAAARREQIQQQAGDKDVNLARLEQAVKGGEITIDDYAARVADLGYDAVDVQLLVALLVAKLGAATPPGA